jgi:hypothetical protein
MSEPENFLARWSRRKRAGEEPTEEPAAKETALEKKEEPDVEQVSANESPRAAVPPAFDLSSLPSIESIAAGTDIRPFLAPGVPAELTRAALRRAWTTDPGIRDFIGLSENAWDFTKGGPAGFGPLLPMDDVKKMLAEVFSHREEAPEVEREGEVERDSVAGVEPKTIERESCDALQESPEVASLQSNTGEQQLTDERSEENDAPQNESEPDDTDRPPPRRIHGGALPE